MTRQLASSHRTALSEQMIQVKELKRSGGCTSGDINPLPALRTNDVLGNGVSHLMSHGVLLEITLCLP